MSRRTITIGLWTLMWMAIIVGHAPVRRASTPNQFYVVASTIDLLPNPQAATRAIIHGAFFFWMDGGRYTAPQCGSMYFTCPPGSEAMCRQQWKDIVDIGLANGC